MVVLQFHKNIHTTQSKEIDVECREHLGVEYIKETIGKGTMADLIVSSS